jgi:hypothetical protein
MKQFSLSIIFILFFVQNTYADNLWNWDFNKFISKDKVDSLARYAKLYNDASKYTIQRSNVEMEYFFNNSYERFFIFEFQNYTYIELILPNLKLDDANISNLRKKKIIDLSKIDCNAIDGKKFDENNVDFLLCPLKSFQLKPDILNLLEFDTMTIKQFNIKFINHRGVHPINDSMLMPICKSDEDLFNKVIDKSNGINDNYYNYEYKELYVKNDSKCNNNIRKNIYEYLAYNQISEVYAVSFSTHLIFDLKKHFDNFDIGDQNVLEFTYYIFVKKNKEYNSFYAYLQRYSLFDK